jgi:hypothetical protein
MPSAVLLKMVGSPSLPARKSVTPTIAAPSNALLAYLDALVVPNLSAKVSYALYFTCSANKFSSNRTRNRILC